MCEKGKFEIRQIRVNQMTAPLGLDEEKPVFSWLLESGNQGMMQKKAQILVGSQEADDDFWDSGVMETDRSIGIAYAGKKLEPETRYQVCVRVWDREDHMQEAYTFFETGLLNPGIEAWEGAQWIGAPEYYVAGDTVSVFTMESVLTIHEGCAAGLVFGAEDWRLEDKSKNEDLLEGENYFRAVIDIEKLSGVLEVYRVGYAPGDRADQPLYTLPLRKEGEPLITEENCRLPHKLTVQVTGNCAYFYVDGCLLSHDENGNKGNGPKETWILNPLGAYDVTTYPRLCKIGYYAGIQTRAFFEGIHVYNLRKPQAEILSADTEKGKELTGECQQVFDSTRHSIPMLRRVFRLKKRVKSARLYASARGIYECSLNGSVLGDQYFAPGASQFDKHLMYQTYDVTSLLREGDNGLGCVLASGWWSDSFSFRLHNYNYWGDRMSFLGKLVVIYEDGSRECFVTNAQDWEYYGEGPYRFAGFFNGEQFDGRKAEIYQKLSMPEFLLEGMKKPAVIEPVYMEEQEGIFPGAACWPAMNASEPLLVGNYQAPVTEKERFTAKSVTEPLPGVYIYDLGQETAGVPILRFHEKEGTRVVIRYGEMLYPHLERYGKLQGLMLQANLREASNTDIYICRGEEGETYQPRFTFHGYRYIEISGVSAPLRLEDVQSIQLSSVEKITGSFTCDNSLVNRFAENVKYSQYCNFISIPTDCPQRNERMGWLGDTHIFCRTASYQADVKNFYLRNLEAIRDLQTEDGRLPSIAPFGGGFGGMTYESAIVIMAWELYQHYGDVQVIRDYYDAMDRWMDAIGNAGLPGIPTLITPISWLGDWLAPSPADDNLIFNAFHYRNACYMARFARILGKEEDVKKYEETAQKTKQFWNEVFVDTETKKTKNTDGSICDVQGSYSVGLSCNVFADEYKADAYAHLDRKTREGNYTIGTGFFGTGAVNTMLSAGGYQETAQKTMTQTAYPSWLYPVTQGATTIWERWNSFTKEDGFGENNSMNSFNHYSLGSVLSWLYENTLGIQRDEENPGFKHFFLRPEIGTFAFAKGKINTPHGMIESEWEQKDGQIVYQCVIPTNTTADLVLKNCVKHLESGSYTFVLEM